MIQKRWVCDTCGEVSEPLGFTESLMNGKQWKDPEGWKSKFVQRPQISCSTCGHSQGWLQTHITDYETRENGWGPYHYCSDQCYPKTKEAN